MKHTQQDQITEYKVEYDDWQGNYVVDKFSAANDRQAIQLARSYGNVHKVTRDHGRVTVWSQR